MTDQDILEWRPLVYHRANHWKRSNRDVARDDLEQEAWLGVMDALKRYDSTRGMSLRTFVWGRIDSKVLDYLREFYQSFPVRGSRRQKTTHYKTVMATEDVSHLADARAAKTFTGVIAAVTVSNLLKSCDERERDLLERHFGLGFRQVELAKEYRLTEGRISQLITRGRHKCRQAAEVA